MAKDPVCGMLVDESRTAARVEYQGVTYYFCSTICQKAFKAEPQKYIGTAPRSKPGDPTPGS
ncbi:MAG: YHS domain-containing protein [Sinimarinibacterium sp.]|jgi:Cu+-exporting ATPase